MDSLTTGLSIGVVGLGLMGTSIAVALLIAGHPVVAIAPLAHELDKVPDEIRKQLEQCHAAGLLQGSSQDDCMNRLIISHDYTALAGCRMVLECVTESLDIKKQVYQYITEAVAPDTVITTNTSAIPISILQNHVPHPGRFLGMHWAEPAYMTRFLEITCGAQTDPYHAQWTFNMATRWGKEPTLLKKDIRGFVTNRLMYAVYREALTLADRGEATVEDMDKAFRYDAGSWMTMMGVFRRMDYMGLDSLQPIFKEIFPQLSNTARVPPPMQRLIDLKAKGVPTGSGFYDYPGEEGADWMKAFARFNEDIDQLAAGYPSGKPGGHDIH